MGLSSHNALKKAKKSPLFGVIFRLLEYFPFFWITLTSIRMSSYGCTEFCTCLWFGELEIAPICEFTWWISDVSIYRFAYLGSDRHSCWTTWDIALVDWIYCRGLIFEHCPDRSCIESTCDHHFTFCIADFSVNLFVCVCIRKQCGFIAIFSCFCIVIDDLFAESFWI